MSYLPYAPSYKTSVPTSGNLMGKTQKTLGKVTGTLSQVSAVAGLLGGIVGSEVVSKTIGQALKDGFDCWGSTWTPSRAKKELPAWIGVIGGQFKQAVDVAPSQFEISVNEFFKTFWGKSKVTGTLLEDWIGWRYTSAKDCTLRGLKDLEKGVDSYLDELSGVCKKIGTEIGASVVVTKKTITLHRRQHGKVQAYKKTVPQISVKMLSKPVGSTAKGQGGNTVPISGNANTQQTMGFSPLLGIGLVAVILRKFIN